MAIEIARVHNARARRVDSTLGARRPARFRFKNRVFDERRGESRFNW
jgi:hypothetical protein